MTEIQRAKVQLLRARLESLLKRRGKGSGLPDDHDPQEILSLIQRLMKRSQQEQPALRAERVERIRAALASGRYAPDLHAVARKLLEEC